MFFIFLPPYSSSPLEGGGGGGGGGACGVCPPPSLPPPDRSTDTLSAPPPEPPESRAAPPASPAAEAICCASAPPLYLAHSEPGANPTGAEPDGMASAGKPVPANVLADYPDLAAKQGPTPSAPTDAAPAKPLVAKKGMTAKVKATVPANDSKAPEVAKGTSPPAVAVPKGLDTAGPIRTLEQTAIARRHAESPRESK
ncbi:MAG: hypothetical protein SGJ27_10345, partial [Candidatus Melainabacteria bacterium]|nr:hypothetical protein [Candidatus Melainabacteria bacterium]